jgi:predicted nucleotidyltransferase
MIDRGWREKVRAPKEVLEQIVDFAISLCEIEQNNLIGVYLHGSLAMGCFSQGQSDIDLLVLVQEPGPSERVRAWAQQILQSSGNPAPLELSVLTRTQFTPWRHPAPFTFHFSEEWRPSLLAALNAKSECDGQQENMLDPDLAGHFTVARRRGVCVAGTPIASALPDIPWPDYLDSILRDFTWACERAQDNPVYLVLNTCRIWAAVVDQLVLSKAEGAAWAIPRLPSDIRAIVATAADLYRSGKAGERPLTVAQALIAAQWIAPHLS